ncbi:MAG TPA: ScyD/ScyE family protein [Nocardioidaceae bacterium]|nr:ScyD/ScyE family protein [Nocardioidaceae bacterium]
MRLRLRAAMVAGVAAAVAIAGSAATAQAGGGHHDELVPVVDGLNGPRGIGITKSDRLVYAEADGTVSKTVLRGPRKGHTRVIAQVPAGFIAPAVDSGRPGVVWILTAGADPGGEGATLYRWTHRSGEARPVADIAAYQAHDIDPFDLEDLPDESNPYGVAGLKDGSALVADAAGNDLLRVWPNGRIRTVARLKPRVVEMPEGYPEEAGLPPAGTPIPSEAVATSVTVGRDGYYYVGELRGFPATPGTSQIWRIAPNAKKATCNPEHPYRGKCKRFADGFTSLVDLGTDKWGGIYAVELVKESWLKFELGLTEPIGSLYRIPRRGGEPRELAAGQVTLPGGVATDSRGRIYLTQPIFGEGTVSRVKR